MKFLKAQLIVLNGGPQPFLLSPTSYVSDPPYTEAEQAFVRDEIIPWIHQGESDKTSGEISIGVLPEPMTFRVILPGEDGTSFQVNRRFPPGTPVYVRGNRAAFLLYEESPGLEKAISGDPDVVAAASAVVANAAPAE